MSSSLRSVGADPRTGDPARRVGPILVTGMPRSGTTWVARLLATAPGTALPGREPMNPRGRQYALGSTLTGWTVLDGITTAQRLRLRAAYAGVNPRVFSRYGRHQWTALLPRRRVVVKDPFAMLSIPEVTGATGASAVLLYRHPGAALSSYRQMGWEPDVEELVPLLAEHRRHHTRTASGATTAPDPAESVAAMAWFWSALYEIALDRIDDATSGQAAPRVLSHEELAGGGPEATERLFEVLGLQWGSETSGELSRESAPPRPDESRTLHHFDRAPGEAATGWRRHVTGDELDQIEELTAPVRKRLDEQRLRLVGGPS